MGESSLGSRRARGDGPLVELTEAKVPTRWVPAGTCRTATERRGTDGDFGGTAGGSTGILAVLSVLAKRKVDRHFLTNSDMWTCSAQGAIRLRRAASALAAFLAEPAAYNLPDPSVAQPAWPLRRIAHRVHHSNAFDPWLDDRRSASPGAPPEGVRPVMRQRWEHLLVSALGGGGRGDRPAALPAGLEVDLFEGRAYRGPGAVHDGGGPPRRGCRASGGCRTSTRPTSGPMSGPRAGVAGGLVLQPRRGEPGGERARPVVVPPALLFCADGADRPGGTGRALVGCLPLEAPLPQDAPRLDPGPGGDDRPGRTS